MAKRSFYRAANAIVGKIGGRAIEDVILQLIRSKFLPAIYYMAWKRVLCAEQVVIHWILLSTVCLCLLVCSSPSSSTMTFVLLGALLMWT